MALLLFKLSFSQTIFGNQEVIMEPDVDKPIFVTSGFIDNDTLLDIVVSNASEMFWYNNLGNNQFGPITKITQSSSANTIIIKDIDNDGDEDIIASYNFISIYYNDGNGNFTRSDITGFGTYADLQVEDQNNDGLLDIIGGGIFGSSHEIYWIQNLGSGNFGSRQTIDNLSNNPSAVYVEDLDLDGDLDVIAGFRFGNSFYLKWYDYQGSGNFIPGSNISTFISSGVNDIKTDYIDNDTLPDIVCSGAYSNFNTTYWLRNLGGGNFASPSTMIFNCNGLSFDTGDFDSDGDIDVVSLCDLSDEIVWSSNSGTGSFSNDVVLTTSFESGEKVHVADFNNDNKKDIIYVSSDFDKIALFENLGGTFSSEILISTPSSSNPSGITVVDIDLDGKEDVIVTSSRDDEISSYLNLGNGDFDEQEIIRIDPDFAATITHGFLNNDTLPDLVYSAWDVFGLINTSNGNFASTPRLLNSTDNAFSLQTVDINNDGSQDVLAASGDEIEWFANNGSGFFSNALIISDTMYNVFNAKAHDIDLDGDLDVFYIDNQSKKIGWYENNGAFLFTTNHIIHTNSFSISYGDFADMDNDGDIDVVSHNGSSELTVWFKNDGSGNFSMHPTIIPPVISFNQGAHLQIVDLDNDQRKDILIGSNGYFNQVYWIKSLPGDTFETTPRTISSIPNGNGVSRVAFGDLDNDGDIDPISLSTNFNGKDMIAWYPNLLISSETISICEGDSFLLSNGQYVNTTGVYSDTLTGSVGQDSIIVRNLIVKNTIYESVVTKICNGGSYISSIGDTISSPGIYLDTLISNLGCDSFILSVDISLNTFSAYTFRDSTDFCDSLLLQSFWLKNDTVLFDTIAQLNGCDSISIDYYFMNNSIYNIQPNLVYCDSGYYNGNWYFSSELVRDTFSTIHGCDSINEVDIIVFPSTINPSINVLACDSLFFQNSWFYNSQIIYDTLTNVNGCDSIIVYDLIINYSNNNTVVNLTACDSILIDGISHSTSKIIIDTFANIYGCDSFVTTNLIINQSKQTFADTLNSCDSLLFSGSWYYNSQIIQEIFTSSDFCDSTIFTAIEIENSYLYSNPDTTACDSILVDGNWITQSMTFYDTLIGVNTCDSIISSTYIVSYSSSIELFDTIVSGENYALPNGSIVSTAGTYLDTFQTISACDSLLIINLFVNDEVSLTQLSNTNFNFLVYPNPASDVVEVRLKKVEQIIHLSIYDILGAKLFAEELDYNSTFINVKNWNSGIYNILLRDENGAILGVNKFIVE